MLFHTGVISLIVAALTPGARAARGMDEVPRYTFEPGRVVTFHEDYSVTYQAGERSSRFDTELDLVVHVIRRNGDGSFRLVFDMMDSTAKTLHGNTTKDKESSVFYADLFPDGRELPMQQIEFGFVPGAIFPPLPTRPAELSSGWTGATQETVFRCIPTSGGADFEFDASFSGPGMVDNHAVKFTFDRGKGFVRRIEDTVRRDGRIKGQGGGTVRLVDVKEMPSAQLKKYAQDCDRYFAGVDAYLAGMKKAQRAQEQDVAAVIDAALADLKPVVAGISAADLKADGQRLLREHGAWANDLLKSAQVRSARVGKAAPDFQTTDVDGRRVRLADLRGKVVMLDFWYRGCAWCARVTPQLNQLASDFAGKPVAIYGMSTDRDPADTSFVIRQLHIQYPTLRAEQIAQQFGVKAYPTLIVIDQHGVLRRIEEGYSATLRQDLAKVIDGLLEYE